MVDSRTSRLDLRIGDNNLSKVAGHIIAEKCIDKRGLSLLLRKDKAGMTELHKDQLLRTVTL